MRAWKRSKLTSLLLMGLCSVLCSGLSAGDTLVLKNFSLIDGTGTAVRPGSALIVENGRITWVGPAAQLKTPAGARVDDYSGKFLMPGLIDLHVHLGSVVDLTQDAKFITPENLDKHLKMYAWLPYDYSGPAWTPDDVTVRLAEIVKAVEEVSQAAGTVAREAAAHRELADRLAATAADVARAAQGNAYAAQAVTDSAEDQSVATQEIATAATTVVGTADRLTRLVRGFRV